MAKRFFKEILLFTLFFLSGATSLVYETLWLRTLSLGVGATSFAMSMVLAIFFAGMAIGSYASGQFAESVKRPLIVYGALECAVGIMAALIIYPLVHFHSLVGLFHVANSFSVLGILIKFILVGLFLIVPTLCMGATFPLMIKASAQSITVLGRSISRVYAINTFGAVFGACATSFWLMPELGLFKANFITGIFNLLIFGIAFLLSRGEKSEPESESVPVTKPALKSLWHVNWHQFQTRDLMIFLACFVCGFTAITAQVVWSKYLGIFLGTNLFGNGIILSMFLLGIAVGSLLLSCFVDHIRNLPRLFFSLLVINAFFVYCASYLLDMTPIIANVISYYIGGQVHLLIIKSVLSALLIFPATLLFGATLPLGIRVLTSDLKRAPQIAGFAYSLNTVGSILGAFIPGLLLIPTLGSAITLKIAIIFLLVAVLVWIVLTKPKSWVGSTVFLALLAIITIVSSPMEFKNIIKGAYSQTANGEMNLSDMTKYFGRDYEEFKLVFEGKTAIISLSHDQQDGPEYKQYLRLKTNGLNESIYDLRHHERLPKYEGLLGFIPYMLVPEPHNAFVVGYGGGFTVDFLTRTPLAVDVVELEEGILKAAQVVHKGRNPILKRKNLNMRIEDARFVLATERKPYDIIISQPSQSWLSGIANLFTREFFEIVRGRLSEKGVFAQWLNLYNTDTKVVQSILRTFFEVFPYGYVFSDYKDDQMVLVGSTQYYPIDMGRLDYLCSDRVFQKILTDLPINTPSQFLTNLLVTRDTAMIAVEGAPFNTDVNAYAEVRQSRLFYSARDTGAALRDFLSRSYSVNFLEHINYGTKLTRDQFLQQLINDSASLQKFDKFYTLLGTYEKSQQPELDLANICYQAERIHCSREHFEKALAQFDSTELLNGYVGALMSAEDYASVIKVAQAHQSRQNMVTKCYVFEAQFQEGLPFKLMDNVQEYLDGCGHYFEKTLAKYYLQRGDYEQSIGWIRSYLSSYTNDLDGIQVLITGLLNAKKYGEAQTQMAIFQTTVENERTRLQGLKEYFDLHGWYEDSQLLQNRLQKYSVNATAEASAEAGAADTQTTPETSVN